MSTHTDIEAANTAAAANAAETGSLNGSETSKMRKSPTTQSFVGKMSVYIYSYYEIKKTILHMDSSAQGPMSKLSEQRQ